MKRFIITNLLSAVAIGMMACSWVDTHNYYLFSVCSHEEFSDRCNKLTLQNWRAYMGLDEEYTEFLGNKVVCHQLPIRPGRNLAVIVESAAVNYRQKKMGYNAARELYKRVQQNLAKGVGED